MPAIIISHIAGMAVFGVPSTIKPFKNIPYGRTRVRLRNDSFGMVFIKTELGIRKFPISDMGDYWTVFPEMEQGRNLTV